MVAGTRRASPTVHPLIAEAGVRARALLKRNLTSQGLLAATPGPAAEARAYTRIFGRDASICALAMSLEDDPILARGARASLMTLGRHQAANGQIPKYVDPAGTEGDFWYLGCIDATLWWLIAVHFVSRRGGDKRLATELAPRIDRALAWLRAQEHPRLHLVQQNEASDWADIMPRSGFVLYSNALWYRVKRLYRVAQAEDTRHHFNHLFHPFTRDLPEYRRLRLLTHYPRHGARERELYLSFVNFSFFGQEGDVFGNLLAVLFGLPDPAGRVRILRALLRAGVDQPVPVRATLTPIRQRDRLWRPYMARHGQNFAHRYHNGGAWPFIGGFWILALAATGRLQSARRALLHLAEANRANDWQFNEWFHGQTGTALGMPGQSWNAAMLLLARRALSERVF